jgi:hypothetical protein
VHACREDEPGRRQQQGVVGLPELEEALERASVGEDAVDQLGIRAQAARRVSIAFVGERQPGQKPDVALPEVLEMVCLRDRLPSLLLRRDSYMLRLRVGIELRFPRR